MIVIKPGARNSIANLLIQKAISVEKEAKQKALGEFKALPVKLSM